MDMEVKSGRMDGGIKNGHEEAFGGEERYFDIIYEFIKISVITANLLMFEIISNLIIESYLALEIF